MNRSTINSPHARNMASSIGLILALFLLCGCPPAQAQVPVQLYSLPVPQFFNQSGVVLSGGILCTYASGTNTPLATYTSSAGTTQQTNPIRLNSAGRPTQNQIWLSASAYKFVLAAGGTCGSPSNIQWTVDPVQVGVFANGNNSFTGNNTFSGTNTFSGATTLSGGGALSGSFSGSPTFTGNPTFSNDVTFNDSIIATADIKTDTINGTLTNGGNLAITGQVGSGAAGETVILTGGAGSAAQNGGGVTLTGGNPGVGTGIGGTIALFAGLGGSTGGVGGSISSAAGNAQSGNSNGGALSFTSGTGAGTGHGGDLTLTLGVGGTTSARGGQVSLTAGQGGAGGNGGDVFLLPGAAGAGGATGSTVIGVGRIIYQGFDPGTCSSTGIGGAGTCNLVAGSTDSDGEMNMIPAAGVAATGLFTLTFAKNMGAYSTSCVYSLRTGTGTWNARATLIASFEGSLTATGTWDNNAVALTAASSYGINYHCVGRQ